MAGLRGYGLPTDQLFVPSVCPVTTEVVLMCFLIRFIPLAQSTCTRRVPWYFSEMSLKLN